MSTQIQKIANAKGWTFVTIAERWNISERQVSRIAKRNKQRDLDAIHGLPKRRK